LLDAQLEQVGEMGGEATEAHLRMGRPTEEILRLSEELVAGLIVGRQPGSHSELLKVYPSATRAFSDQPSVLCFC
jgi:hypothetical protein